MKPRPEAERGGARAITSLQNERVKLIRSLNMRKSRRETGLFVAEGASVLLAARDAGWKPTILAFLAGIWALYLKFFEATSFVQTPLPLLVSLCVIAGLMCLLMGLLAELIMRVYYESQSKTDYRIKSVLNARPEDAARNDH